MKLFKAINKEKEFVGILAYTMERYGDTEVEGETEIRLNVPILRASGLHSSSDETDIEHSRQQPLPANT